MKTRLDIATVPYEVVDALVDTDPIALRDLAWAAIEKSREVARDLAANEGSEDARLAIAEATLERLRAELAAIRDIAYRAGTTGAGDALEAIHARASRAARQG